MQRLKRVNIVCEAVVILTVTKGMPNKDRAMILLLVLDANTDVHVDHCV